MTALNKKNFIAKSFRIEERLAEDLGILAEILERSQNDLANVAIEKLLKDNLVWLKQNIFVDHLHGIFLGGLEEDTIEIQNIKIFLRMNDDDSFDLDYKDSFQEYSQHFEEEKDCIKKLRELTMYLDDDCPEVRGYLKSRFDYM